MALNKKLHRINGEMLSGRVGESVGILGEAIEVDSNGTTFKLKTGDNKVISVYLEEPSQDYIGGFVEVFGKVTSKSTIICSDLVVFPPEYTTDFNISFYNSAVEVLHKHEDLPVVLEN